MAKTTTSQSFAMKDFTLRRETDNMDRRASVIHHLYLYKLLRNKQGNYMNIPNMRDKCYALNSTSTAVKAVHRDYIS